jgi:hypothetical protein
MYFKKQLLFCLFIFWALFSVAQEGTRTTTTPAPATVVSKIMVVPFDPKLYMSEIDQKINQQTKWNFETIREKFRHELDTQLKLKLQSITPVVSFYTDSAKMAKDLGYVYKSTGLSYDLVAKPSEANATVKKQTGIKNGQLEVEMSPDKKFMNTKLNDKEVLPYLHKKYQAAYFVFINELDIKNDLTSYDMTQDLYQREMTVHYSILDQTGKTLAAGVATTRFSSKENNPKKISALCFPVIVSTISEKFSAVVTVPKPILQKN